MLGRHKDAESGWALLGAGQRLSSVPQLSDNTVPTGSVSWKNTLAHASGLFPGEPVPNNGASERAAH